MEKKDDLEKGQKKQPPKIPPKPAKGVRHKAVAERAEQEVPGPSTDVVQSGRAVENRPGAALKGLQEVPICATDKPHQKKQPPVIGKKPLNIGAQGQQEVPICAIDKPHQKKQPPEIGKKPTNIGAQGQPQQEVPKVAVDAPDQLPGPSKAINAAENLFDVRKALDHSDQQNADNGSKSEPIAGPTVVVIPAEIHRPSDDLPNGPTDAGYVILGLLGKGGFGKVYKAKDPDPGVRQYAIKVQTDLKAARREQEVLRVFRMSEAAKSWNQRHYPIFYKLIQWEHQLRKPSWIVIELLGKSLHQIRVACFEPMNAQKRLSIPTIYGVMVQCIQAIEQLHEVGFIHRDLSPGNFAVGRKPPNDRVVYVFDFGLCRKYRDRKGQIIPTESFGGFVGTPLYCAISAHLGEQQYRRDDFNALIYVFWEMLCGNLQWGNQHTRETANLKRNWFISFSKSMPTEIQTFFGYIEKLEPDDRPPYEDMCERFRDLIQKNTAEHTRDERSINYEWLCQQGCEGLLHWNALLSFTTSSETQPPGI